MTGILFMDGTYYGKFFVVFAEGEGGGGYFTIPQRSAAQILPKAKTEHPDFTNEKKIQKFPPSSDAF